VNKQATAGFVASACALSAIVHLFMRALLPVLLVANLSASGRHRVDGMNGNVYVCMAATIGMAHIKHIPFFQTALLTDRGISASRSLQLCGCSALFGTLKRQQLFTFARRALFSVPCVHLLFLQCLLQVQVDDFRSHCCAVTDCDNSHAEHACGSHNDYLSTAKLP
jgi:hypothetical protein